ncbi:MAG: hypothetical protein MUF50_03105 [Planctomycetes bacterium]|jgi:hypothetical protein|nr:hypothetical protein [Planctomycetota bacterium]
MKKIINLIVVLTFINISYLAAQEQNTKILKVNGGIFIGTNNDYFLLAFSGPRLTTTLKDKYEISLTGMPGLIIKKEVLPILAFSLNVGNKKIKAGLGTFYLASKKQWVLLPVLGYMF